MDRTDKAFLLVLALACAAALFLAVGRMRIERANRTVEIIVDADDVRRVASAAGITPEVLLRQLKGAGATALGVRELTLKEMLESGLVTLAPGGRRLVTADPLAAKRLASALTTKLPELGSHAEGTAVVLPPAVSPNELQDMPLLLRPDALADAHRLGLRVVARLGNYPQASPAAIETAAAEAARAGAKLVVFRDDQVLGYQALLQDTAEAFVRHGLQYGYVEIAEQKGEEALAARLAPRLLRVHSITDADLETITPYTAVMRYARAVRERGIRAAYVRLLSRPLPDPARENVQYLSSVVKGIQDEGFMIGPAAPLSAPTGWPSPPARWLVALGIAAGVGLLLRRLIPLSAALRWALVLALAGLLLAVALVKEPMLAPLGGLLAASVFPALGLAVALQQVQSEEGRRPNALLRPALRGLLLASLFSLAGGLLVVGIYAKLPYLQGIGTFAGVKLSYLLPVLVALLVVIAELPGTDEPLSAWWGRTRQKGEEFLRSPVSWGGAIVVVVTLAALALALMRSGNESAVAPTGLELKMRSLLETILIARPRTKEFLLGHPALMLSLALLLRGRRGWLPLLVIIGALGQISLLNTFCHFHIPLYLSLLRSLHGLWLGALFGGVFILAWRLLFDRTRAKVAA